jgi:hypothetical protein
MQDLQSREDRAAHERNFLEHTIRVRAPEFVREWMEMLCNKVGQYDTYLGNPQTLHFDLRENWRIKFQDGFWKVWVLKWCGMPVKYDYLLETIKEMWNSSGDKT